ncbi:MAG: hypothetical protein BGWL_c2180 [Candidatus Phytoplasma cynodontis]|uniref:DUF2963 domain-containing protein n=1 Tax='Cynodon dactylon' phytoplasma TaxID=295320 RepID=UPI001265BB47|nr:hypothetical protein ['Cynodon dactylon' phytoplasma]KAB8121826.1 hypothetical protein F1741_01700 ['Cynodon dactylon' phytoplasma]WIA07707.1 MAG: hypothetical protein BGWL_c2180 [Candidatus Phytoplasma cynodontis]
MSFSSFSIFFQRYFSKIYIVTISFLLSIGGILIYLLLIPKDTIIKKPLSQTFIEKLSDGTIKEYDSKSKKLIKISQKDLIQEFQNGKIIRETKIYSPFRKEVSEFYFPNGKLKTKGYLNNNFYTLENFDENEKIIKKTVMKQKDGKEIIIEKILFDENQRKQSQEFFDEEEGYLKSKCYYDGFNKEICTKEISYSKDGKIKYIKNMDEKNGNIIKHSIFNLDDQKIETEREYYRTENSKDKLLIKQEKNFEKDGKTIKNIWMFDKDGSIIKNI